MQGKQIDDLQVALQDAMRMSFGNSSTGQSNREWSDERKNHEKTAGRCRV
jgi:hypothetical protein